MNKHINKNRDIALTYVAGIKTKEAELDNLKKKFQEGNIAKNDYSTKVAEIKAYNNSKKVEAIQSIIEVENEYKEELDNWAELNVKDLSDDIKLFNSPIDFTADDYRDLETKYQTNFTMLKAIKDHARKGENEYTSDYSIDKAEKVNVFNKDVIQPARKIVETTEMGKSQSYTARIWDEDETFNEVYVDVTKFIQTLPE